MSDHPKPMWHPDLAPGSSVQCAFDDVWVHRGWSQTPPDAPQEEQLPLSDGEPA